MKAINLREDFIQTWENFFVENTAEKIEKAYHKNLEMGGANSPNENTAWLHDRLLLAMALGEGIEKAEIEINDDQSKKHDVLNGDY